MRRAFFVSVWILGFSYALQMLVLGNSGLVAYGKAMEVYTQMENNVLKLSLKSLEAESKLKFLKSTIAGNVAHELGYFQADERAVFPVISTLASQNESIPLVRYKKDERNESSIKSFQVSGFASLLTFCLLLAYSLIKKGKSKKNQCSLVQTASRT